MKGKSLSFVRCAIALSIVLAPGIVSAQAVTSTPVTRTISVSRVNGVTTAFVNGTQVSVPYQQNGVTIRFNNNTLFTQSLQSSP